jgi:hypothetical protein
MPDGLVRKSMALFAESVAPVLRENSLKLFQQQFGDINLNQAEAIH